MVPRPETSGIEPHKEEWWPLGAEGIPASQTDFPQFPCGDI